MKTNELNEKLRAALIDVWKKEGKMVDFCMNDTAAACQLSNGMILTASKQRIEKSFCFGWSSCGQGPEFSEACRAERNAKNDESYFIRENMRRYSERLEMIDSGDYYPFLAKKYYSESKTNPLRELCFRSLSDLLNLIEYDEYKPGAFVTDKWGNEYYIPTEDDMNRICAMYEEARTKHEKKVRSYLKRYGTSKVKTWTYWLDD